MSDPNHRSVSWFTVAVVFVGFGLFLALVRHYYQAGTQPLPYNVAAEGLPEDQQWMATPESRLAYREDLTAEQSEQLHSYGWVNEDRTNVRLPIERAIELTLEEINSGPRR